MNLYCSVICCLIITVIGQVTSQTIWLDIDSGKVVGVSQGQNQQPPNRPQQQYPHQNNGHSRRPNWRSPNVQLQPPFNQPNVNPVPNNVDAEWICRHSRTGDTMIIASEITNRTPEQQQPNQQQPPIYTENPYQHNPWLDRNSQNPQQNPYGNLPDQNPRNPMKDNSNNLPISVQQTTTEAPTEPPIILTTSTKKPFPTLDNFNWAKYVEGTTKKSRTPNLNEAITGEGVIIPRGGDFQR